ncbi:MAG: divergent polysaccharide deacetylase family protein, partial [Treponema sp.]|nr:divergent polysaccharide deacetylase family protein [Treponema sp.]
VAGMNNHEGSAITADEHKMEVILKFASENGIYFLDSRTNKDTKVPYVSNALGFSYYERNGLFLDNEKTRANALTEIKKNIAKANKEGYVVMIGHVWSADFLPQLLQDLYPILKQKGYVLKTVSDCKGKK